MRIKLDIEIERGAMHNFKDLLHRTFTAAEKFLGDMFLYSPQITLTVWEEAPLRQGGEKIPKGILVTFTQTVDGEDKSTSLEVPSRENNDADPLEYQMMTVWARHLGKCVKKPPKPVVKR